jgi:hypothetical protein
MTAVGVGDEPSSRAPPTFDSTRANERRELRYVSDPEYVDVPPLEPVWSD